jgi:hypothetical protein
VTSDSPENRLIDGRYRVVRVLGVGAQGRTFLAHDEHDQPVALKRLTLADALDWKTIELFEREGNVLADLEHPRIPQYIEAFKTVEDGQDAFYLAQTYIEGDSLEDLVTAGERWDRDALVDFFEQMLGVLDYLGRRRPPVVHRDIKPTNILRDADGNYHLIDFGAVQTVVASSTGASTVIGTGGFVPVEQLMGRATPASDLYSLGATAAYLATGTHPSDMESVALRLQFRRYGTIDPIVASFIERLLEPKPSDRFESAKSARAALRDRTEQTGMVRALPLSLENGLVEMEYEDSAFRLRVKNPPTTALAVKTSVALVIGGFLLALSGLKQPVMALLGMPFLVIGALVLAIKYHTSRERDLELRDGVLTLRSRALGRVRQVDQTSVRELVDIVVEHDKVQIVDGLSSYEIPYLESSRDEVVRQLRAHTGLHD